MKRLVWLAVMLLSSPIALADTGRTTEVVVLASRPTHITRRPEAHGFELKNQGPNSIFCSLGGTPTAPPIYSADGGTTVIDGKTREVESKSSWAGDVPGSVQIWCIAHSADQATGAATIITDS